MRFKLIATALGLGLFAFVGTGRVSAQYYGGYGNGNHDLSPHWHTTQTPFGGYSYYGNGFHDLRPHDHTADPFNGVTSYSNGPFRSTQSYNGFPGGYGYSSGFGTPFGYGGADGGVNVQRSAG
jgi:hypothetical protein